MKVYELRLKVFLLKNIPSEDSSDKISEFIDEVLGSDKELLEFHKDNCYKNYCFNEFYPLEKDKIYKEGRIYTIIIRTIDERLESYFKGNLANHYNNFLKGLIIESRILPKKHIDKLYSITPVLLKQDEGYWKNKLTLNQFEDRLVSNLIKKYNYINNTKIEENFQLYNYIEFKNNKPCSIKYKEIKLLGDKLNLQISDNEMAQELAYMALGTGVLENNSRGLGFMNYRWL